MKHVGKKNSLEIICLLKPIFWGRSLIPNLSLDYQKNMKYNSNKQVVSSLTTLLYGQHRNSFSLDSRPNILHAPEFFAHPHRVLIFYISRSTSAKTLLFSRKIRKSLSYVIFLPVLEFLIFIWQSVSHNQFLLTKKYGYLFISHRNNFWKFFTLE